MYLGVSWAKLLLLGLRLQVSQKYNALLLISVCPCFQGVMLGNALIGAVAKPNPAPVYQAPAPAVDRHAWRYNEPSGSTRGCAIPPGF